MRVFAAVPHANSFTLFSPGDAVDPSKLTGKIILRYHINDKEQKMELDIGAAMLIMPPRSDAALMLHRIGGKRQLQELTDEHHAIALNDAYSQKGEKLRQKIELLSCQLNLVSKYTALIGVDPTELGWF